MTTWYIRRGEYQRGPFPTQKMKEFVTAGYLLPTDIVWREGMSTWQPARDVAEFFPRPPATPDRPRTPPAPGDARVVYVKGDKFKRPRFCIGCMAPEPDRRTDVTGERPVVGPGDNSAVAGAVVAGVVVGVLVGPAAGGLVGEMVAGTNQGPDIGREKVTFVFPICEACQRREQEAFFNPTARIIDCVLCADGVVFVFSNLAYAEAFRKLNRLGPPPAGVGVGPPQAPAEPAARRAPPPPADSPFGGLEGETGDLVRAPARRSAGGGPGVVGWVVGGAVTFIVLVGVLSVVLFFVSR
jgi:hypothetical protein